MDAQRWQPYFWGAVALLLLAGGFAFWRQWEASAPPSKEEIRRVLESPGDGPPVVRGWELVVVPGALNVGPDLAVSVDGLDDGVPLFEQVLVEPDSPMAKLRSWVGAGYP